MDCPNCHEPVDVGAAFCGNCGQAIAPQHLLTSTTSSESSNLSHESSISSDAVVRTTEIVASDAVMQGIGNKLVGASVSRQPIPTYAQPHIGQQKDHFKAAISVVFGVLGVVGSFIMPFVGLILAIVGVITGTLSRRYLKKGLGLAGIVISTAGILVSMGTWAYAVSSSAKSQQANNNAVQKTNTSPALAANQISTPCYEIAFAERLNVQNTSGSCNMNAFDGSSLDVSHSAYKVFATQSAVSPSAFAALAKTALERDIAQSMPGYKIVDEQSVMFSGSPAYVVRTTNSQGVSLLEAAVLHSNGNTANFYVIVHATVEGTADLHDLELGWQWH